LYCLFFCHFYFGYCIVFLTKWQTIQ
jgi:hypothetical protein